MLSVRLPSTEAYPRWWRLRCHWMRRHPWTWCYASCFGHTRLRSLLHLRPTCVRSQPWSHPRDDLICEGSGILIDVAGAIGDEASDEANDGDAAENATVT